MKLKTIIAISFLSGFAANAATVTAPNAQASAEGNSNSNAPLFRSGETNRYQQVYNSSQFGSTPFVITAISFRLDSEAYPSTGAGVFSGSIPNVSIHLSTTAASATTLSTTFASNFGADYAQVFSGSLALSTSSSNLGNGTKAFDITIPLQTPFTYNPTIGNLLFEYQNFTSNPLPTRQADAVNYAGEPVAWVWNLSNPNASTATFSSADPGFANSAHGLVTQFTTTTVPEPSTVLFGVIGVIGLLVRRTRNERSA